MNSNEKLKMLSNFKKRFTKTICTLNKQFKQIIYNKAQNTINKAPKTEL